MDVGMLREVTGEDPGAPIGWMHVVHEEMLPSMGALIPLLNWRGTLNRYSVAFASAGDRTLFSKLLYVWSKACPRQGQKWSAGDPIWSQIQHAGQLHAWILQCVACSLLGNYRHARVRPGRAAKRWVYREVVFASSATETVHWMFQHMIALVFLALREYMVFLVEAEPALDAVLRQSYQWGDASTATLDAMDRVRSTLHGAATRTAAASIQVARALYRATQPDTVQLPPVYRSPVKGFRVWLWEQCQSRWHEEIFAESVNAHPGAQIISEDRYRQMQQVLARFDPTDQSVCFEWLCTIGLPITTVQVLARCHELFDDQNKKKECHEMFRAIPRDDFLTVYTWSRLRHVHRSVAIYRLPTEWCDRQRAVLARNRAADDVTVMPPGALTDTSTFFCFNCMQLHAHTLESAMRNSADREMHSEGHPKILYDMQTGRCYCAGPVVHKGSKTRQNKGDMLHELGLLEPTEIEHKNLKRQRTESRRAQRVTQPAICRGTELQRVDMLGHALFVLNRVYVLCPQCLHMTTMDMAKFGRDLLTCGVCTRADDTARRYHRQCFYCELVCTRAYDDRNDHERRGPMQWQWYLDDRSPPAAGSDGADRFPLRCGWMCRRHTRIHTPDGRRVWRLGWLFRWSQFTP